MAEFYFDVDTGPMARSIDEVNGNVRLVGTAVTAMQAAVIASERSAAKRVCESVDNGIYMLLRSRISQRVAQFASTMNSKVGSMMETASAIDNTHGQMQGDFNRMKARYMRLFEKLDHALEKRVRELDRPAMEVARQRASFVSERQCRSIPAIMYYASDISGVSLRLSNARVKRRASSSIEELAEGTRQLLDYDRATASVFEHKGGAAPSEELVPVVYAVAQSQVAPDSYTLEVQPPESLEPQTQATIARGVRAGQDQVLGSDMRNMGAVRSAYLRRITSQVPDHRLAQTMLELFNASFPEAAPRPSAVDGTAGERREV